MPKGKSDRKLASFSTITEIIVNVGTIGSWVASLVTALVLRVQKNPVIIPGFNITLDANFQFALVVSGVLAYIQYLQGYWKKK
jgi:hypothetical protein